MNGVAPGLLAVIRREVRWIRRDPVVRFLLFGVPVIAFGLLGLTFSAAVVRGSASLLSTWTIPRRRSLFVQTVAAAPGIAIVERANDLGAAARAIRGRRAASPRSICRRISSATCAPAGGRTPSVSTTRSISRQAAMPRRASATR